MIYEETFLYPCYVLEIIEQEKKERKLVEERKAFRPRFIIVRKNKLLVEAI